jgi:arylsulfatase A-like enzyme
VLPTVFPACGLDGPSDAAGIDLSPAFGGTSSAGARRFLFSEFQPKGDWHGVVDWRLVTDNRHKYVWNRGDIDELYDLSKDPHELKNLSKSADAQPIVETFRRELLAWMQRTNDPLVAAFQQQSRGTH